MNKGKIAAGILMNDKKEILLHLRDNKPDIDCPNTWGFIGGHVEKNEGVLEALKREILEEVGLKIKDPVFISSFDDRVGHEVFVYKILVNVKANKIKLNEGQMVKFFSLEDAFKLKNLPRCMRDFFEEFKDKIFK